MIDRPTRRALPGTRPGHAWARPAAGRTAIALGLGLLAVLPWAPAGRAAQAADAADITFVDPAPQAHAAWGQQVGYRVEVSADGKSSRYGEIPDDRVLVTARYRADLQGGPGADDDAGAAIAIQAMAQSNCFGCHDFASRRAGPSFREIQARYASGPAQEDTLAAHILHGSAGAWGQAAMPPHPDMAAAQATRIAQWLLRQQRADTQYLLGTEGSVRMQAQDRPGPRAGLVLQATYLGTEPGQAPATGRDALAIHGDTR